MVRVTNATGEGYAPLARQKPCLTYKWYKHKILPLVGGSILSAASFNPYDMEKKMGRGDRRHSLKMARIKSQNKKKARIARAIDAAKAAQK